MLVKNDPDYNEEFPELYDWNKIDNIIASESATDMAVWIRHDLRTEERLLVPGLRKALNIIASQAAVY